MPASTKPNLNQLLSNWTRRDVSTIKISILCRKLSKFRFPNSVTVTSVMMRGVRGLASPMVTALLRMSPMVTRPRMMSSGPREEADIVIAGGGMVGCSAAVALANLGKKY